MPYTINTTYVPMSVLMICTIIIDVLDSANELPISLQCTMVPFRSAVTLVTDNTDVN